MTWCVQNCKQANEMQTTATVWKYLLTSKTNQVCVCVQTNILNAKFK
jgi:hypothetical protein